MVKNLHTFYSSVPGVVFMGSAQLRGILIRTTIDVFLGKFLIPQNKKCVMGTHYKCIIKVLLSTITMTWQGTSNEYPQYM